MKLPYRYLRFGLRLLKWGFQCVRLCLFIILCGVMTLFFLLADPPPFLHRLLIEQAIQQTHAWTALPLQIEKITTLSLRPWRQVLELENLRLYGYQGAQQPFLILPRLRLEVDMVSYLRQKPGFNQLILTQPRFFVQRDSQGRFNVRPRFKLSEQKPSEPGPRPFLPRLLVRFERSLVQYQDQNHLYPLKTTLHFPDLQAELQDQEFLDFSGRLRSVLSNLDVDGRLNIWSGQTQVQVAVHTPNLQPVAGYAVRVPQLRVYGGQIQTRIQAQWQDYHLQNLHYQGRLQLNQFKVQVPQYRMPVTLSAAVEFTQARLQVEKLQLHSPGHHLALQGSFLGYLQPEKLRFNAHLQAQALDLGELARALHHPAIHSFRRMNPSGILRAKLQLIGTLKDLQAQGILEIPHARIRNIQIQGLTGRFRYETERLEVPFLRLGVFGGWLQTAAHLKLGAKPQLAAQLKASQLSLASIKQAFSLRLPRDYNPEGHLDLEAQAVGPLSSPRAWGQLSAAQLNFTGSQKLKIFNALKLHFDYTQALSRATLQTHSPDMGMLQLGVRLTHMNHVDAWLRTEQTALKALNPFLPGAWLKSGQLQLQAHFKGSLPELKQDWQRSHAQVRLVAKDLTLDYPLPSQKMPLQQHVQELGIDLNWQRGHAHVKSLKLDEGQSHLWAQGSVFLPALRQADWSQAVQAHLEGQLNTQDFPILKNYQVEQGQFQLALDARGLAHRDIQVELKTRGQNLGVRGVKLAGLELESQYGNHRLQIQTARFLQNQEQLELKGQIDLSTPSPTLDLHAHTFRFDLPTLLTLLPPEIRAALENRKTTQQIPPADPTPRLYALPKVRERLLFQPATTAWAAPLEKVQAAELVIPLGDLMEAHWERWKLPPAAREVHTEQSQSQNLLENLAGKLSLDLRLTGSLVQPHLQVQSSLQDARIVDSELSETYLQARYANRRIYLDKVWLQEKGGGVLRAAGEINLDQEMQLELQGEGISLKVADPFLKGNTRLEGNLDFFAVASGPVSQPEISMQMTLDRLLMNRLFFDRMDTISGYRNGYLKDLRVELKYGNQEIVLFGDVPVRDLNNPVDLSLSLKDESFGLLNLFTNALDWRQGKGAVLVRLVGTPRKPELEGTFRVDKATVYLPALKETLKEVDIKGEVFTKKVHLDYLKGKMGEGSLAVSGTMDLLNLLPSFLNLEAMGQNLLVRYTMPGLLTTQTAVKDAKIKIKGLVNQPVISGKVVLGRNGETTFPFLKDRQDLPTSSEVKDESGEVKPPRFLFGGLKVEIPFEYGLHSPIFDIPVYSEKGINLRHWSGKLAITGDIKANKGTLYLFNNALKIDQLDVNFPPIRTVVGQDSGLNPDLRIETSFNVKGAEQPVKARITGKLEDLKRNQMHFEFSNKQGLTDTQIFNQIFGGEAVAGLTQGDIAGTAAKFSDVFLRGLFNPLTTRLSELLGLEQLSLGIVGQSVSGPVFSFNIRSNPFFLVEDLIETRIQQLSFLNRLRISGEGMLSDQAVYKLGGNYNIDEHWALDYQFKSDEQLHKFTIKGSYSLPAILEWLGYWRQRFKESLEKPTQQTPAAVATPSVRP